MPLLQRRKRLALICLLIALMVLVPAAVILSREPQHYRSSAVLFLERRPPVPIGIIPIPLYAAPSAKMVLDTLPKSSVEGLEVAVLRASFIPWPVEHSVIAITAEASRKDSVTDIVTAYITTIREQGEMRAVVIDPPSPAVPIGLLERATRRFRSSQSQPAAL